MKETIPCTGCSNCGEGYGTGFTGGRILRCLLMDAETTADDGCTHGEPGEPQRIVQSWDVSISGHEAVHGWL